MLWTKELQTEGKVLSSIKGYEVAFNRYKFLHLTGVKPNKGETVSAIYFYEKCLDKRLTEHDFFLAKDGSTGQKLDKILRMQELIAHAEEHLAVTYFKPDDRKEGGKYETVTGTFRKIRDYDKMFILEDGTGIACDMIYELEVNGFWK